MYISFFRFLSKPWDLYEANMPSTFNSCEGYYCVKTQLMTLCLHDIIVQDQYLVNAGV